MRTVSEMVLIVFLDFVLEWVPGSIVKGLIFSVSCLSLENHLLIECRLIDIRYMAQQRQWHGQRRAINTEQRHQTLTGNSSREPRWSISNRVLSFWSWDPGGSCRSYHFWYVNLRKTHPSRGYVLGCNRSFITGTTGEGLGGAVREAYSFLSTNYSPGDEIFLIGFSRGAFTARTVAGLIDTVGLLTKKGLSALPEIFRDVKHQRDPKYKPKNPNIPFPDKPSVEDPLYLDELIRVRPPSEYCDCCLPLLTLDIAWHDGHRRYRESYRCLGHCRYVQPPVDLDNAQTMSQILRRILGCATCRLAAEDWRPRRGVAEDGFL